MLGQYAGGFLPRPVEVLEVMAGDRLVGLNAHRGPAGRAQRSASAPDRDERLGMRKAARLA
jgi:hypothetical protein